MSRSAMAGQMKETDIVRLEAKFVVPIAITHILRGEEDLDDVAEYTINEMIAELQPDTALLCLALCARNLAAQLPRLPIARALGIESNMIIEEYGPVWLANAAGQQAMSDQDLRTLLSYIPEDLESLSDLLGATLGELEEEEALAAILCDILGNLADAHREAAENELADIGLTAGRRGMARPEAKNASETGAGGANDNVVPFPLK